MRRRRSIESKRLEARVKSLDVRDKKIVNMLALFAILDNGCLEIM